MSFTIEPAMTVKEVSKLLGFTHPTIIRLFEKERGTIIIKRPETNRKRGYRSIRIPREVYERVRRRLSV